MPGARIFQTSVDATPARLPLAGYREMTGNAHLLTLDAGLFRANLLLRCPAPGNRARTSPTDDHRDPAGTISRPAVVGRFADCINLLSEQTQRGRGEQHAGRNSHIQDIPHSRADPGDCQ
jgi:hypothetical protein